MSLDPLIADLARARATADPAGLQAVLDALPKRPTMRAVHHLACSGGTLIARAIAAQPNTLVLSELDPFTSLMQQGNFYPPTDLIQSARSAARSLPADVTAEMFLAGLDTLSRTLGPKGTRVVLRAHSHSHFHTQSGIADRPALNELLRPRFETRQIVTVRHPLDCWLGLEHNGWMHFQPATFDEYCRRTEAFLSATEGLPRFCYEDFVSDPENILSKMLAALDIPVAPDWQDHMGDNRLSGDSGRSGLSIAPRPRRELSPELIQAASQSAAYARLCVELGFDPDPKAPPRAA